MATKTAMFGAGCFWGVEAEFRRVEGVTVTEVGYAGGNKVPTTYQEVCGGRTGHAEVVRFAYDPERVAYDDLLAIFFTIHDPTQLNRQGSDVGSQYRSAIFCFDADQEQAARAAKKRLGELAVTEIKMITSFVKAEEYHQQYLAKRGQIACASTIRQ